MNSTPTMLQAAPSGGLLTPPNSGGPGPMMGNSLSAADLAAKKAQEREALRQVIQQWNANRLDLFELSEPNEDLEFHGVMRFYFQDSGQKVATKCIRVASTASTQAVIETLIEKFRPDMRMLSVPEYALYEIHENGDERRLGVEQRPLLVQLNWHRDDREGRFLLRRIDDKTNFATFGAHGVRPDGLLQVPTTVSSFQEDNSFKRKLSKREKKQLKKQEKLNKIKSVTPAPGQENDSSVAEKLYTELPETSFTRSISNPEAVMRRRRQQKLERKLQQFRSKDGGPDTGGTLKIYGEALCRDVPYKTLLLSVSDTAHAVVKEMLSKYGLEREDPLSYCLVQVNVAPTGESKEYHGNNTNREYILDDDECPLAILMNHPSSRGSIMFHVRRRPADYHPRKRKKKPSHKGRPNELLDYRYEDAYERLPYLLELNPDGSDVNGAPKKHRLQLDVTEVGGDRPPSAGGGGGGSSGSGSGSQTLQLFGPNIQPRHCVIANTGGIVTVTPCSRDAETYVNGVRIYETTILQHGAVVKFGRIHNFRFLDPLYDERTRQRHDSSSRHEFSYDRQQAEHDTSSLGPPSSHPPPSQNYETTFDVDGHVETISTASLKEDARSQRSISSSRDGNNRPPSTYERYPRGQDPILPAVLEFREETRDALFDALIPSLEPAAVHFKLAPTYALYLAARYRASTHFRPDLTPTERAHRLSTLLERLAAMIQAVIQERYSEAESLAFWMANASELLHFLKSDRHISAFSLDAQDILAETVQMAFRNLVECLQTELAQVMPVFLAEDRDEAGDDEPATAVLAVLAGAMALLRRCRVNAALTIQLFSQLFHFVNMWAFNRMVCGDARLCTRQWGLRLKARLGHIEEWAEKQGLELAADCHLSRIVQAAHLLQAPKYNADDLATLSSTCFKLNSLQLRALLHRYQPATDEPRLPHELIDNVVRVAESVADELARSDGREVRLEEDVELALPFLLPEDGYSCDVVRGMPVGLSELLAPLQNAGLCRVTPQPTSSGLWTIYMTDHSQHGPRSPSAMSNRSGALVGPHQEPEVQVIKLHKSNNGMGLSIVAAKGAGQERLGIYIKSVVKGGAADAVSSADGRLQAGDQLLKVDGQSLVGITQEKAAEYLVRTGPVVTLEVAKQGAIYHGLATLLSQPSPVMGRGPRRMSERDLPNRVLTEQNHNTVEPRRSLPPPHMPSMQSSKSVPALNSNNGEVHPPPPANAAKPSHEVFNPGYSRTSSTNSIPQKAYDAAHQSPNAGAGIRSRSSHNLHDNAHGMPPLPPHAGQAAVSRQASTPILPGQQQATPQSQPQQQESERFYQNLSVYRSSAGHPEHPGQVNGYPAAPPSPSRGKMPSPHDDRLMGQQMPPQPQQQPPPQQQQQQMNMKTAGTRGSQSSLPRPTDLNMVNSGPIRDRPASAYLPQHGPQHPHGVVPTSSVPRSQSARDMLRQEAKLHEMQEEVRRREARGPPPMNSPNGPYYPGQQHPANLPHSRSHPQLPPQAIQQQQQQQMRPSNTFPPGSGYPEGSPMHPNGPYPAHHMQMAGYPPRHPGVQVLPSGPPTAPKPRGPRGPYDTVESAPGRPPPPDDMYRESPPPPPPPTSTHPLYQPGKPPQAADNRYAASMGEPPRGAYMPTNTGRPPQQPYGGTNPWDREEREKEQLRRREAARQWRDQQISELEALQGSRTPQQEEQLRALRLEREFQRRAEEAARLGDDDEEEGEETTTPQDENGERPPQGLLMRSSISPEEALRQQQFQQHMARARLVQSPNGDVAPRPQQSPATSDSSAQYGRQQPEQAPAQYGRQMEERDRQRKLEEMRRKQLELEAAKEAEERILREAQRRREEELRLQREQQMREQQFLMQQQQIQQQQQQQQQLLQQQQQQQLLQQQQQQHFHAQQQQQQQAAQSPAYHSPNPASSPAQRPPHTNHLHPAAAHQYKTASPSSTTPLRLEGLNNSTAHYNGHPPHTTNGPYSPHDENLGTPTGTQRLDSLLHSNGAPASPSTPVNAPPPPERGSSFNVMQQQQQQQQPGGVLRNSSSAPRSEPKRVSFHDPKASPPEVNNHVDRPREDPNNFINEAQTLLATPRSPDGSFTANTPGVIGAQEVYKDPRMRRLAEQQHQKLLQTRQGPGPEKLSFKEKMKMFAMETGEDGTPKDKVKISRAQRDIEGVAQPNLNNNSLTAATDDRNY